MKYVELIKWRTEKETGIVVFEFKIRMHNIDDSKGKFDIGFASTTKGHLYIHTGNLRNPIRVYTHLGHNVKLLDKILDHKGWKSIIHYEFLPESYGNGVMMALVPPVTQEIVLDEENFDKFHQMKRAIEQHPTYLKLYKEYSAKCRF